VKRLPRSVVASDPPSPSDCRRHIVYEVSEGFPAVLIATPQYNASLPGQLKNALDWASRPYKHNVLRGKSAAAIRASPSPSGAARAQSEARAVLAAIGAEVLDTELALARAPQHFTGGGELVAPEHRLRLAEIVGQLATRAGRESRLDDAA
jgi:chromate reductase